MLNLKAIIEGKALRIKALTVRASCDSTERCAAIDFIEECKKLYPQAFPKITARLDEMAENGIVTHKERFKWVRGGKLGEIKVKPLRLFCFRHPVEKNVLVLVSGCKRESSTKKLNQEMDRAEALRDEFYKQLQSEQRKPNEKK